MSNIQQMLYRAIVIVSALAILVFFGKGSVGSKLNNQTITSTQSLTILK